MEIDAKSWQKAKKDLNIGDRVLCVVTEHQPFGVLVSLENVTANGVIERIRMESDGFKTPDEYPPVGSHVHLTVLGFRDYSHQVELSVPRKESVL